MPFMSLEQSLTGGGSRCETIRLRSTRARLFFLHQYTVAFGKPPTDTALRGVLDELVARATFGDEVHSVFIRQARHNGAIYIDRGTPDGSAYEIDKVGWHIIARPRVRFLRVPGMLALPEAIFVDPREGLLKLKEVTRFQTERDNVLVIGFLLDTLGGEGPYCVLVITGEPGSAKSTLAKLIGFLVDPRRDYLLSAPKSKRDVYISASNRGVVAFNNLSTLEPAISDAICTATEGGVDSQRALYTDGDESSIYAKTPFILVSIGNVVTRGDLADRTLKTELAAIPPSDRIPEPEFWAKVQLAAPIILGALLGALSEGLRRYDNLDTSNLPRIATSAKFVTACETAFWPEGTFAAAFAESAATADADVLSNDPVAETFEELMADKKEWKGTVTKLLSELETIVRRPEREAELALAVAKSEAQRSGSKAYDRLRTDAEKEKDEEAVRRVAEAMADLREAREHVRIILNGKWPKAGNALSRRLKEFGPQLKATGIHILWPTSHGDGKILTVSNIAFDLRKERSTQKSSSSPSDRPPPPGDEADKSYDINDLSHSEEMPWDLGERPSPARPGDGPTSFEPNFLSEEPGQPDWSDGFTRSTKPNVVSAQDKANSSKLRGEDEGYAI
jgi:hypothetical protein